MALRQLSLVCITFCSTTLVSLIQKYTQPRLNLIARVAISISLEQTTCTLRKCPRALSFPDDLKRVKTAQKEKKVNYGLIDSNIFCSASEKRKINEAEKRKNFEALEKPP